jgi:hypothetical protein
MNGNVKQSERERLSRTQIEERASHMLQYVLPDRGDDPSPPDLMRVISVFESKHKVRFFFTDDLGSLPGGQKILGVFTVAPFTIRVCASVEAWSPPFRRTLAHELGHLVLHRNMIGDGKYISREKPVVDTAEQLRYRETAELSDLGWVEWQANEFSMCLILPRRFLQILVVSIQNELGIKKNLGTMYLDDQPCNRHDCKRIVGRIAEISGAKDTLIWRRLRFLGILEDHQKQRARPAFEALDALFDTSGQQDESTLSAGAAEA